MLSPTPCQDVFPTPPAPSRPAPPPPSLPGRRPLPSRDGNTAGINTPSSRQGVSPAKDERPIPPALRSLPPSFGLAHRPARVGAPAPPLRAHRQDPGGPAPSVETRGRGPGRVAPRPARHPTPDPHPRPRHPLYSRGHPTPDPGTRPHPTRRHPPESLVGPNWGASGVPVGIAIRQATPQLIVVCLADTPTYCGVPLTVKPWQLGSDPPPRGERPRSDTSALSTNSLGTAPRSCLPHFFLGKCLALCNLAVFRVALYRRTQVDTGGFCGFCGQLSRRLPAGLLYPEGVSYNKRAVVAPCYAEATTRAVRLPLVRGKGRAKKQFPLREKASFALADRFPCGAGVLGVALPDRGLKTIQSIPLAAIVAYLVPYPVYRE